MVKGCSHALAAKYYFIASKEIAILLDALFLASFPDEHGRYKEAFEAGVWQAEDPGPWLGRVIV